MECRPIPTGGCALSVLGSDALVPASPPRARRDKARAMDAKSTVNEFIRRVVDGEYASAGELVSDDVEYDNVPIGKNHGREALVNFLTAMMKGVDELVFETHRQAVAGNVVMNERTDKFRIGDKWLALPVAGVFELDGAGRITLWRDYFDIGMYQKQMAAITKDS
jgi:limonene-1,2-epoxide hydrolase